MRAPLDEADIQTLVGCGRALLNERIAIVEPESSVRLPAGQVGEVWVAGPNVAGSYWRNAGATKVGLNAAIAGEEDGTNWLRTGDLYRRTVMPWGSAAIAGLALAWLVQRAFF